MSKFVSVGKILNFHGIQGEAKVGFSKGQEDFLLSLDVVFVKKNNEYLPLKVVRLRLNKTFALIKFEGINSINDLRASFSLLKKIQFEKSLRKMNF